MSFFPEGIELSDIRSPSEILAEAQTEWEEHSNGLLLLRISPSAVEGEDEFVLDVYIIHSPSKRMMKVLSVAHRPSQPYPVEIRPESFDIPRYLKKRYTVQARGSISPLFSTPDFLRAAEKAMSEIRSQTIVNEWVCETPGEFRENLQKALNLGTVKSAINNIVAGTTLVEDGDSAVIDSTSTAQPKIQQQFGETEIDS